MDTALPQKFPFILDRNLAWPNCTENRVCTSCDTVVLDQQQKKKRLFKKNGEILIKFHSGGKC